MANCSTRNSDRTGTDWRTRVGGTSKTFESARPVTSSETLPRKSRRIGLRPRAPSRIVVGSNSASAASISSAVTPSRTRLCVSIPRVFRSSASSTIRWTSNGRTLARATLRAVPPIRRRSSGLCHREPTITRSASTRSANPSIRRCGVPRTTCVSTSNPSRSRRFRCRSSASRVHRLTLLPGIPAVTFGLVTVTKSNASIPYRSRHPRQVRVPIAASIASDRSVAYTARISRRPTATAVSIVKNIQYKQYRIAETRLTELPWSES